MWRLLLFFTIFDCFHCHCPAGFEIVNDECRGNYTRIDTTGSNGVNVAIDKCKGISGQPIIIHNDEDQLYWRSHISQVNNAWTVFGLLCNATSKKWEWADGSALDYVPHGHDFDLVNCLPEYSWVMRSDGYWSAYRNDDKFSTDVFCIAPLRAPSIDVCYNFEDDIDDGVCYQIGMTAESWQDAQMICAKLGANLASIHNLQENLFIRRLAVSKGAVNGVFLGATKSGKGNEFGWIDGSDWDYDNTYPGFPMAGVGDCLAMDTTKKEGQWMNVECSEKLPVACMRGKGVLAPPECTTGPSKEEAIILSPGFPYNASVPCDFFLDVDEGKTVEVEIILLEANPCCDFLVIHDLFLGGNLIANITGQVHNVTYTSSSHLMRVSWQPNSGKNVRGLAMTYRGV